MCLHADLMEGFSLTAWVLCPHIDERVGPKDVVLWLAQSGFLAHPCGPWGKMQWLTNNKNEGEVFPLKEGILESKIYLVNR